MQTSAQLSRWLPLLIPVLLLQLILLVIAMRDLLHRPPAQVRGSKWLWVGVILFINTIGPILYLTVGRNEEA